MAHISISKIVRKVTLCYLVQVDNIIVLHLREDDGSHKYFYNCPRDDSELLYLVQIDG